MIHLKHGSDQGRSIFTVVLPSGFEQHVQPCAKDYSSGFWQPKVLSLIPLWPLIIYLFTKEHCAHLRGRCM